MVIVHIPQKGPWEERHHYPAKRLGAWAAANGAGFVDALPALTSGGAESLYYPKDGHATPAGYGVIAEQMHDYIVKEVLAAEQASE